MVVYIVLSCLVQVTSVVSIDNNTFFVGFRVLTAVIVKSFIFRDMSCNPFKVNRRFGRIYDLMFKIKPKKEETCSLPCSC
jgi:hypothetical protein